MEKLSEVETAKALMSEAITWSVVKWLREKKRVRKTADIANTSLDHLRATIQNNWPDRIRAAYDSLGKRTNGSPRNGIDAEAKTLVKQIKDVDEQAARARSDAEETFDKAEKRLSTSLARAGCRKAIQSWELHEKAIHQAESVIRTK